ncbi:MAG TPA: conjugal transfer protein TraG [Denitromonas sp.]|uniref:conjugal transfer protein TraG n=1 Tax=Salaquimonas pukyongi TaxID=2712698 RepID=UPI00096BCE8C|nr:conjugal transfer protein TraG [Salaquimonas pukyongi]HPR06550.1 conjugal transfer protein TraG [Denitromonas sp.]
MQPTTLLIGQAAIVTGTITGTLWASTQWTAYKLGYQPGLGEPWFEFASASVYYPWRLFEWWYAYEAYAPEIFRKAGTLAAGGGILGTTTAIIGSLWRARQTKNVTTYGSAKWASDRDIASSGLLQDTGVFLGRTKSSYLRHDGPDHVLAFAPTRSGKGVGLVVPTLLTWTGSTVVHDIKGENWTLTAGWRSRFSHCLLFNPTDPRSAKYNPLIEVRKGPHEVRDVQNIADILVDPEGALEKRNHWEKTGHSLLTGAILHVLYAEEEKTLARVATFLANPKRTIEATLRIMLTTNHLGTKDAPKVHPEVASIAREMLNKSENELSGVVSTAMSFLEIYRDPIIAETTSRCEWRIDDLKHADRPVSLYLVVPPSDISRTKPLIRLILNQIGRRLTEKLPNPNAKKVKGKQDHPLLMMLDEFPALGRLDFFETAMAFMAGYGIRAFLIAQSLNQIEKAYGPNNSILDNAHVRVAFATNDDRTAKRISDALGTATELRAQKNYAGHRLAPWLAHVMVSRQETARPLLTPGEVMQLPSDEALVMLAGSPPIRARKLRYYEDNNFTARLLPAPELSGSGTYADCPQGRAHDWGRQTKKISRALQRRIVEDHFATGDEGGLKQEPSLFDTFGTAPDPTPSTDLALLDDDFDGGTTSTDALARSQTRQRDANRAVQRAHAINNDGHKPDLLPEF